MNALLGTGRAVPPSSAMRVLGGRAGPGGHPIPPGGGGGGGQGMHEDPSWVIRMRAPPGPTSPGYPTPGTPGSDPSLAAALIDPVETGADVGTGEHQYPSGGQGKGRGVHGGKGKRRPKGLAIGWVPRYSANQRGQPTGHIDYMARATNPTAEDDD